MLSTLAEMYAYVIVAYAAYRSLRTVVTWTKRLF